MGTDEIPAMDEAAEDIGECLRAISGNPRVAELRKALGDRLFLMGRFQAALANYAKAYDLDPAVEGLKQCLNWAEAGSRGEPADNIAAYQRELKAQREALVQSARTSIADDDGSQCFAIWQKVILGDPCMLRTLDAWITKALEQNNLQLAARYAKINASLRLGSRWYPFCRPADHAVPNFRNSPATITVPKLEHDLAQFEYLRRRGWLDEEVAVALDGYRHALERLRAIGPDAREPLTGDEERRIGDIYNRLVHVYDALPVAAALSDRWDRQAVQRQYRDSAPGLVVVDNFLSEAALEGLRTFCCASTIWSANVYAQGRLGSFFRAGFNCPLLVQMAEELRSGLPDLLHDANPLRQLWGFKYPPTLTADTVHADFASVNVNFWITPGIANLDDRSGGMIIYDREAPSDWDFDLYNKRTDLIRSFLQTEGAKAIEIPYRENRAIIFNSNLFHETAPVRFRPEYDNRRINVTLLYGDRG
jgi:tetratricopeptide (TPR) repeat protein